MLHLLSTTLALFLGSYITSTSAVPNVTVVPLTGGCSAYPSYDPASDSTGIFILQADSTDNSSIEGFGASSEYSRGANQIRWGEITIVSDDTMAKTAIRCSNNTLQGYVETGVSSVSWQNLKFSPYPYDAELTYFIDGGPDVQPYSHYIGGVQQQGVFLGANNITTWGFKYWPKEDSCCGVPFYEMRLLGPNSADPSTGAPLMDGEFEGFVKVE